MATSRFASIEKITYDDETIFEERERLVMAADETDETYRVQDGDTWRGIAYRLYGEARYYWILVELHHMIDPFEVPRTGRVLRCPTLKRILEAGY